MANRKGVIAALFAVMLPVVCAFLAYGIDMSMIAMERSRLQNAVDAAALAASQEIVACVEDAGLEGESGDSTQSDVNSIASAAARSMAVNVAALNGVTIDQDQDVEFGKRLCTVTTSGTSVSESWDIAWSQTPYNTVGVKASKTVPLLFGAFVGKPSIQLEASAAAFVEARDLVVVLDFSGSMNYDSQLLPSSISKLGQDAIEDNLDDIWTALDVTDKGTLPDVPEYMRVEGLNEASGPIPKIFVTFKDGEVYTESSKDLSNVVLLLDDGSHYKFDDLNQGPTGTFAAPYGRTIEGCWVKSGQNSALNNDELISEAGADAPNRGYGEWFDGSTSYVLTHYGLDSTPYPFASGSWWDFVNYCRTDSDMINSGYRKKYGGRLFANYVLDRRREYGQTNAIWRTPHYPFNAVKNGCTLFLDFLEGLEFGDDCGIVSYDTTARIEDYLSAAQNVDDTARDADWVEGEIDLSADPICDDYAALDTIQRHKQAAHYDPYTGIGAGLLEARDTLTQYRRYGARPTILLMTDGNANKYPSWFSSLYEEIPNFNWADWTDFDGDGDADYSTSDRAKQYAIYEAIQAVKSGYVIHTMSVGTGADRNFMKAVAFIGSGEWIDVPGGATIAEMEDQMLTAFGRIASNVPPPKLVYDVDINE